MPSVMGGICFMYAYMSARYFFTILKYIYYIIRETKVLYFVRNFNPAVAR